MTINLRNTRKALGLTQAQLADALGIDQAEVSRFETGRRSIDTRTALAVEALALRMSKGGQGVAPAACAANADGSLKVPARAA